MKRINHKDFKGLIENLKCETGTDNQTIGFRSKFNNFEMSFCGHNEDGYDVMVEDFGRMCSGKWVQMEPMAYQIDEMDTIIFNKIVELAESRRLADKAQIQLEIDNDKYGTEGAIYSNHY